MIAGLVGTLIGSLLAYWLGYAKGREWLLEIHWLHITAGRLEFSAERWFDRWATRAVAVIRCVPLLRAFISLPAGIARMPVIRFSILTIVGVVPFVVGLTLAGEAVRANWKTLSGTCTSSTTRSWQRSWSRTRGWCSETSAAVATLRGPPGPSSPRRRAQQTARLIPDSRRGARIRRCSRGSGTSASRCRPRRA